MNIKLEQAVNTRQKFKVEVEALELRIKELNAEIADLLDHAEGTTQVGDYSVNISRRRTLNKKKFTGSFPESMYPEFYKSDPNTAEIRKAIAPNELDTYYDLGAETVTIK